MAKPKEFPINAARAGHNRDIIKWQASGGDIDENFEFEDWSPMHLLAAEGNEAGVAALLDCGADPDGRPRIRDLAGVPWQTPLQVAARYGHAPIVSLLCRPVEQGGRRGGGGGIADVNARDSHGFTALHHAALHGHGAAADALLATGANPALKARGLPLLPTPSAAGGAGGGAGDDASYVDIGGGGGGDGEGFTAAEVALYAGHRALASRLRQQQSSQDEQSKLQRWLTELGCGAFFQGFLDAGYDFSYIAAHGLGEDDVEAIGIPAAKLGLRKKLLALHQFPNKPKAEGEGSDEDEDEDEDDDEDSEDDSEEEDSD